MSSESHTMGSPMKILGIETSCDETAICLIEARSTGTGQVLTVLGNQLYSQVAKHKEFGGVFPMLAKREHQKNLVPLFVKCLEEVHHLVQQTGHSSLEKEEIQTKKIEELRKVLDREVELFEDFIKVIPNFKKPDIDAIAVTNGPGLEPALWVGVNFAKALSALWDIPVIATNHMEGHVVVSALQRIESEKNKFLIKKTKYPAIALLISGGHTELVLVKSDLEYEIVGRTRDDAVGEAYDKVARMLGLPYPGGPEISKLADVYSGLLREARNDKNIKFPRPMIYSKDLDFSFSGLKTSVLYLIKELPKLTEEIKQEISFEFQNAVIDVLVAKTKKAVEQYGAQTLIVGGGVIANKDIRIALEKLATDLNIDFQLPEISASTDNALMIALAGFLNLKKGKKASSDFKAVGNLSL
jgi:N6-L-threonylcarbamoyladenine synthase